MHFSYSVVAGATSTVNVPAGAPTSEQTMNEEGRTEELEVDMDSNDEGSHMGSTAAGPQDTDKEDTDVEKKAEECESSNGNGKGETSILPEPRATMRELHPDVSSGDLGKVVHLKAQRDLTDNEKYFLLKHHFVSSKDYHFSTRVINLQQRHFQNIWLDSTQDWFISNQKMVATVSIECSLGDASHW